MSTSAWTPVDESQGQNSAWKPVGESKPARTDFSQNPPLVPRPAAPEELQPGNFAQRAGDRMQQNLNPNNVADGITHLIDSVHGGAPDTRLRDVPGKVKDSLVSNYSDPANIVGDVGAAALMGPLGEEGAATEGARIARPRISAAPAETTAATGRLGRLVNVAKDEVHVPILGKVGKYAKAWNGPPAPEAPIPSTNGIPWGSGGDAPLDLRGKMIPPPRVTNVMHGPDEYPITNVMHGPETPPPVTNISHGPAAPPREVLQGRGLAVGGRTPPEPPSVGLGKIPMRAEPIPAPENNEAPFAGRFDKPIPAAEAPTTKGPIPGSKEDIAETKGIQEQARDTGEREDRARLSAAKSDWFQRNGPQRTKGELTGTAKAPSNPLVGKRMDYSAGPRGVNVSGKDVPSGTKVPGPNEDLSPILRKSLRAVKAAKEKKGS